MKTIKTQAIITGIRSRADGSVGLSVSTPELVALEKTLFFELQNVNVEMTITPLDEKVPEEHKIEKDLNQKTQSQRIRATLFILWKQNPENMEFEEYYRNKTEKYILGLQRLIEQ